MSDRLIEALERAGSAAEMGSSVLLMPDEVGQVLGALRVVEALKAHSREAVREKVEAQKHFERALREGRIDDGKFYARRIEVFDRRIEVSERWFSIL